MFEKGKPLSEEFKQLISETQVKEWHKFRAMIKACDLIMTTDADPGDLLNVVRGILAEHYKEN